MRRESFHLILKGDNTRYVSLKEGFMPSFIPFPLKRSCLWTVRGRISPLFLL